MLIQILGPGCPNCKKVLATAQEVTAELGVEAHVEKVTDYAQIAAHGVVAMPGIVIDGAVVSTGRVPTKADMTTLVTTALAQQDG